MPRRSAERRGRPQADVRGNAKHPWRSPHWPRIRMRSFEVPVRILPFAPFGAPPPLIFLEANAFVQWLAKTRAQKNAPRERSCFVRPRAKRGGGGPSREARWWKGSSVAAWFSSPEFRRGRGTPSTILRSLRSLRTVPLPRAASLRGGG